MDAPRQDQRSRYADIPYEIDDSDPETRLKVRVIVGELYYRQFYILWALTLAYYLLVVTRDILTAPPEVAMTLHSSNAAVIISLMLTFVFERLGKIGAANIYLAPIPTAIAMVINVYLHVVLTADENAIARGLLVIMAFSVVSMLPWVFWLLTGFATLSHICIAYMVMGPESTQMIGVGIGAMMVSYGGFVVRYNSIREQARLNLLNQERAEKLEQLARAKDEFIANMSHELRTPLTGLMGMVDLLDKAELRPEERHYLNTAKTSAETLRIVINDILDLSKLGAGKLSLKPEPFNLVPLLSEVAEMMAVGAKKKNIALALKLPEEAIPTLVADQARLRQILFNLLGNAVKFTNEGQVILSAKVIENAGETMTIRLAVEDTGVGIAGNDMDRLFNRFEQVDSSSTREQSGTGLGLAICSELAELMDSRIHAESRVGEGSCFWFDLTAVKSELSPDAESEPVGRTPSVDALLARELTVLVAEDNPVNQMLIRKLTSIDRWTSEFVSDGKQALEAARKRAFDLILMDIQMPLMNGEEAARAIRNEDNPNRATPIIALTANCMPEDVERYLSTGMNDSIAKPIKLEEFYLTIARHVNGSVNRRS